MITYVYVSHLFLARYVWKVVKTSWVLWWTFADIWVNSPQVSAYSEPDVRSFLQQRKAELEDVNDCGRIARWEWLGNIGRFLPRESFLWPLKDTEDTW